jgi:pimeloyl-ACP methyl ester carboxylesterase
VASVLIACLAAVVLASATAAGRIEGPFGHGDDQVWIMPAHGPPRDVVVFAHGWEAERPVGNSWARQFRPWLRHLAARGSAVIFPRYQYGSKDVPGPARARAFRRGVRLGLRKLGAHGLPVVVAGYSFGGSLAMAYAADSARWSLPRPSAVDAIFPAGPVRRVPFDHVARRERVLLQVGDRDDVAGTSGAKAFWHRLRGHPRKAYRVVHSHGRFVADHAAPKLSSRPARHAFWAPLDRLIAVSTR